MNKQSGIGKLDRKRLTALLRGTQYTISVAQAALILDLSETHTAKILSRLAAKSWITRVKRGLYVPTSLESISDTMLLENPWAIAEKIYPPCYIGGWSAAEYWGLTEQIFRTVVVLTTRKPRNRQPIIKDTPFLLHTISEEAMFGLKAIWQGETKTFISDPTRTILDFLIDPKMGGGIRTTVDMLQEYLKSKHKNLSLLIEYASRLHNSAVFKRLGFLLEQYAPEEKNIIEICKQKITISKTWLDPQLNSDKLITRWRLWVPTHWEK